MCKEPELSNKKLYPTFARTYPGFKQLAPSLVALLKHFKWNKVALIEGHMFEDTGKFIKKTFAGEGIVTSHEVPFSIPKIDYNHGVGDNKFPSVFREIKEKARSKYTCD